MSQSIDRRTFIGVAATAGLASSFDWQAKAVSKVWKQSGTAKAAGGGVVAFRRTGRGRHVSRAAKAHNANHLYANAAVAAADRAHPGDKSKVVPVTISVALFQAFFGNGRTSVDIRHDLRTLNDYKSLIRCQRGPGQPTSGSCISNDLNGDRTVDQRDIGLFQRIFTGS